MKSLTGELTTINVNLYILCHYKVRNMYFNCKTNLFSISERSRVFWMTQDILENVRSLEYTNMKLCLTLLSRVVCGESNISKWVEILIHNVDLSSASLNTRIIASQFQNVFFFSISFQTICLFSLMLSILI